MAQPIVTLFELYGSGAEDIGPRVADALGVQWEPQAFTSASIEEAEAARIEQPDDGVLSRIFRTLGGSPSVLEDRGGQALFAFSSGPTTPIYVPLERIRDELQRRGFTDFAEFEAGRGVALLARKPKAA